jgi:hypothetical protein
MRSYKMRITESKARRILAEYGLRLWRDSNRWFACKPTEGPAFADASGRSLRELLQEVVPCEDWETINTSYDTDLGA